MSFVLFYRSGRMGYHTPLAMAHFIFMMVILREQGVLHSLSLKQAGLLEAWLDVP